MKQLSLNAIDKSLIESEIKEINNRISLLNKRLKILQSELTEMTKDNRTEEERLRETYPVDYCFSMINTEGCLWDLRYWNGLKYVIEVIEWLECIIESGDYEKNCGHCTFCIYILLVIHKVDKDKVIEAVMNNDKITYQDEKGSLI